MLKKSASVGSELADEIHIPLRIPCSSIKLGSAVEKGSYGVVRRAKWMRSIVAVKVLPTFKASQLSSFLREMSFACGLRHPDIVATMGAVTGEWHGLVMELMPWGSLRCSLQDERRRKHFDITRLKRSFLCICRAGAYLASVGVLHRDISSKNVFVAPGFERVKLGDFGISSLLEHHVLDQNDPMYGRRLSDTRTLFVGAPAYKAPELLGGNPTYSQASDVYAFSIVVWEMLTTLWTGTYGKPWADVDSLIQLDQAIHNGTRPPLEPEYFSLCEEEAKRYLPLIRIIEDCWAALPKRRPTFLQAHDKIKKTL